MHISASICYTLFIYSSLLVALSAFVPAAQVEVEAAAGLVAPNPTQLLPDDTEVEAYTELNSLLLVQDGSSSSSKASLEQDYNDAIVVLESILTDNTERVESSRAGEIRAHLKELIREILFMHEMAKRGDDKELSKLIETFGSKVDMIEREFQVDLTHLNGYLAHLFVQVEKKNHSHNSNSAGRETEANKSGCLDKVLSWFGLK